MGTADVHADLHLGVYHDILHGGHPCGILRDELNDSLLKSKVWKTESSHPNGSILRSLLSNICPAISFFNRLIKESSSINLYLLFLINRSILLFCVLQCLYCNINTAVEIFPYLVFPLHFYDCVDFLQLNRPHWSIACSWPFLLLFLFANIN